MSVVEHGLVDGIALDNDRLILLISDHLEWKLEYDHLIDLQAKINAYVEFCDSKQYKKVYPHAQINSAVIQIQFLYEPTSAAVDFLSKVQAQLCKDGIVIECHLD